MAVQFYDTYGHEGVPPAPAMSAGAVSTTAAGTIAPTTNSGASPTVTAVTANDTRGTFTLNPVTGGGAQAAGAQAVVTFTQPYGAAPKAVFVTCVDATTATAPTAVGVYATSVTANGFSVTANTLTTAHNYVISYYVIP